jgi:DNA-binding transcriptional LysR family regulator
VLLKRDRSGVQLTSDGIQILPYIEDLCESWHRVSEKTNQLHGMDSGQVRIGTFTSVPTHWLPGIIQTFREIYPNITFELIHGDYQQIEELLQHGRIDVGFTQLPVGEGLDYVYLKADELFAILPDEHHLAQKEAVTLDELLPEPFIMYKENTVGGIRMMLNSYRIKPNAQFVAEDDNTIMSMVESGLGVTVLTDLVTKRSPYRIVKRRLDPPQYREIVMAYPQSRSCTISAGKFIEHVKAWNEDRLKSLNIDFGK